MLFRQIFEHRLAHYAYLVGCEQTGEAIIFDPQRDIERYVTAADKEGVRIVAASETHIHADFLSGMRQFAEKYPVRIYASDEGDNDWKYQWLIGSKYDHVLLKDGDSFSVGQVRFDVLHTPGHTPEHISFIVTDSGGDADQAIGLISGDFVFVGDVGRPDLLETAAGQKGKMEPSARTLYNSLRKFRGLPPSLQLWPGHGAGSACGKSLGEAQISTVGYELAHNSSLLAAGDETGFVKHILSGQPEPPYYFERMKRDNRAGPAVLDSIPLPEEIPPSVLLERATNSDNVVIDLRTWDKFRDGHIPGSLFAPLNNEFSTITGSYIEENSRIYLVAEPEQVQEAVLGLIRIGLDNIDGFVTPTKLLEHSKKENCLVATEEIDVNQLADRLERDDKLCLLDVRQEAELLETGIIGQASNIAHTRLLAQRTELPNADNVHVYCRSGNRSTYASAFLEQRGCKVTHVAGGILAWMGSGRDLIPVK